MTGEQMETEVILRTLDDPQTRYDEAKAKPLIDTLIARGIYPTETPPDNPNTVYQMVRGWGAWWFEWENRYLTCPLCGVDLRDHKNGPPFMRYIAYYDRVRDRTSEYQCPDCKGFWPRDN